MPPPLSDEDEIMRLTGGQRALWCALQAIIKSSKDPAAAARVAGNAVEKMIVDELNHAGQQPQAWLDGMNDMQEQMKKSLGTDID